MDITFGKDSKFPFPGVVFASTGSLISLKTKKHRERGGLKLLENHWRLRGRSQLDEYIEQDQGGEEIMKVKHKIFCAPAVCFLIKRDRIASNEGL